MCANSVRLVGNWVVKFWIARHPADKDGVGRTPNHYVPQADLSGPILVKLPRCRQTVRVIENAGRAVVASIANCLLFGLGSHLFRLRLGVLAMQSTIRSLPSRE